MPPVLMFFVDGVGAGERDPDRNPFARIDARYFGNWRDDPSGKPLPRGGFFVPADARLGVPGLPQSATGQTTLLTGVNAPRLIGRHLSGFPNEALRSLLSERSILRTVVDRGGAADFVNVFHPEFHAAGERVFERPLSATTWATRAAGLPYSTIDELRAREAIHHEFTNREMQRRGYDVPEFSPEEAALILAARSTRFDLTLYEVFRTDLAGHRQDMEIAMSQAAEIEIFLEALLAAVDLEETLVVVCSDHGNLEDLSFRGHNENPAQTLLFGPEAAERARGIADLADVGQTILAAACETLRSVGDSAEE